MNRTVLLVALAAAAVGGFIFVKKTNFFKKRNGPSVSQTVKIKGPGEAKGDERQAFGDAPREVPGGAILADGTFVQGGKVRADGTIDRPSLPSRPRGGTKRGINSRTGRNVVPVRVTKR